MNFQIEMTDYSKLEIQSKSKIFFENLLYMYNNSEVVITNTHISSTQLLDTISEEIGIELFDSSILKINDKSEIVCSKNLILHNSSQLSFYSKTQNNFLVFSGHFIVLKDGSTITIQNNTKCIIKAQIVLSDDSDVQLDEYVIFEVQTPLIVSEINDFTCLFSLTKNSSFVVQPKCSVTIHSCIWLNGTSVLHIKNDSILVVYKRLHADYADEDSEVENSQTLIIEPTARIYCLGEDYNRTRCQSQSDEDADWDNSCYTVIITETCNIEAPGRTIADYPLFASSNRITYLEYGAFNKITTCVDIFGSETGINIVLDNENFSIVGYGDRVYRFCPGGNDTGEVYCHTNGTVWVNGEEDENTHDYPFTHRYCPFEFSEDPKATFNVISEHNFINKSTVNLNVNFVKNPVWITMSHNLNDTSVKKVTGMVNGIYYDDYCNITTIYEKSNNTNVDIIARNNNLNYKSTHKSDDLDNTKQLSILKIDNILTIEYSTTTELVVSFFKTNKKLVSIQIDNKLYSNALIMSQHGLNFINYNKTCSSGYISFINSNNHLTVLSELRSVCEDNEYNDINNGTCLLCKEKYGDRCNKCTHVSCTTCDNNYRLTESNDCELIINCSTFLNNYCVNCERGYYEHNKCISCENNCKMCNKNGCILCDDTHSFIIDGVCTKIEHSSLVVPEMIISCLPSYFSTQTSCKLCSSKFENCEECIFKRCSKCSNGYYLENNSNSSLCVDMRCKEMESKEKCLTCTDDYILSDNGKCVQKISSCGFYKDGKCVECENNSFYLDDNKCTMNPSNLECTQYTPIGCLVCDDDFYLDNGNCTKCNTKCTKCVSSSDICTECINGTIRVNNECETVFDLEGICLEFNKYGGCTKCNSEYFVSESSCKRCLSPCGQCLSESRCITCVSGFYIAENENCVELSTLTNCRSSQTNLGCVSCEDGYYLENKKCTKCSASCSLCNSYTNCFQCGNNKIVEGGLCVDRKNINFCVEITSSYCTKCQFWYSPSSDKTNCEKHVVWWFILIIVIIGVMVLSLIFTIVAIVSLFVMKLKEHQKRFKTLNIVQLKTSINTTKFFQVQNDESLLLSPGELNFSKDAKQIPVDSPTVLEIIVGNRGNLTQKIQFVTLSREEIYTLQFEPKVVVLRTNEACTFHLSFTPLCSLKIEDKIGLVGCTLKTGIEKINELIIYAETVLSTKLDKDSLHEDKVIGEGSFGVVFRGRFHDQIVAIKRLKDVREEGTTEEFEREVSMLDKFRCDFIVHFYSACFLPDHLCLVTELAKYGSIQDLKEKHPVNIYTTVIKTKLMVDAAQGVEYLHLNGIFHRDIKPANVLVVSLEDNQKVNAKLTDFGSSRNVNSLIQNNTFTKGIRTPIYMPPEVLVSGKYSFESDTYSFGIMLYEVVGWCTAFVECRYVWNIAEKAARGERPPFSKAHMLFEDVINSCWKTKRTMLNDRRRKQIENYSG
ncbi:protein serine/threonine kinase, putative [Entamoeba invadens IP1]|uniref:Protein serine/threonine kinase, putative n=1 Tax=Entamoeba invadens IP1 TaxID=370355 RepID=L7FMX3_ENTIV|nr:protein serine/threonine kinase, putative [Entamoeba invadens IP1]ELP92212.1 protein serine/threonine kinase, putative [Entamoeba invadens IP1]|eukprot:XP_004258983.1 protein serine/threonine kinase, putative [Entamoeba invadens IP1]